MHQILLYSRGGNTKKIAAAIAQELGAPVTDIANAAVDPAAGLLFIGTGCYGGKPGDDLLNFIEKNDLKGRKIALFSTSAGGAGKELDVLAEALTQKGASVMGRYTCKGQFIFFVSRGHPDQDDLAGARKFAREMVKLG